MTHPYIDFFEVYGSQPTENLREAQEPPTLET
jgi:hypothetical protein